MNGFREIWIPLAYGIMVLKNICLDGTMNRSDLEALIAASAQ